MSGYTTAITAAVAVIGAATSAYGQIQSSNAQKAQANFQSKMAERNAQIAETNATLAEQEGKEAKRIGYENAVRKRQEVASVVSAQRAAFSASGAQVDQGSALDLSLDTVEKGELDALALNEQGLQRDYMKRVEAWNLRSGGTAQSLQGQMYGRQAASASPWMSAGGTLLSGLSQAGSNYYTMNKTK